MASNDVEGTVTEPAVATGFSPDFRALFDASPTPLLAVAPPNWIIVAANDARLRVTDTTREEQIGRPLFEVFPDDPEDPDADGVRNLSASLERVVVTGAADTMSVQRYAVRGPDGQFVERWWAPVNTPVLGKDGRVELIIHHVEDVTEVVRLRGDAEVRDEQARSQQVMIDRLRASENAVRASEARYKRIVEGAEDFAIITLDAHGVVTSWNTGAERIIGVPEAKAIGQRGDFFFTPEDRDHGTPDHEMNQAQAHGRSLDERWHQRGDGTRFWGSGLTMSLDGAEGGYLKIFRDRTAEHEAEAAVRDSDARASGVLDGMSEGFVLLDRDFRVVRINAEALRIEQRPAEDILGRTHWEVWPGTEDAPQGRLYKRLMRERAAGAIEVQYSWEERRRWFDVRVNPAPEGLAIFYRDITERKAAGDRLRASEAMLGAVLDAVPVGIIIADAEGRIVRDNAATRELWGVPPETANWEGYGEWVGYWPDTGERIKAHEWGMARALLTGEVVRNELVENQRFDTGERRTFLNNAAPVRDEAGKLIGGVVGAFDITERLAVERRLQESEARYRTLFEAIEVGFCVIELIFDDNGRAVDYLFVEANPAFAAQAGFDNAVGRRMREIVPDHEEYWFELYGAVALTGVSNRFEQGSAALGRWFEVNAFRVGDPADRRVAVLFSDITPRRQAELALRELNANLEQKVEERTAERDRVWRHSLDLLSVIDMERAAFDTVNPAWTAALGWSVEEIEGRPYADFVHPDDTEASKDAFAQVCAGNPVLRFENRYRTKAGGWRWLSWVAVPEGGKLYSVTRDVTADKERAAELAAAEAARRQADLLYRAYFENTAEALFVIGVLPDGGYVVEDLNPAHQASTGLLLAETRGKRIEDVLPAEWVESVSEYYRLVIQSGQIYEYRESYQVQGAQTWWDTTLVPVRDAEGRITRIIGASRNITGQIAAEEALRQSQKMEAMGQLTGGVAHDFNNLLTPIIGSLDLLLRKGLGSERERRLMDGALQSAERAKTLVQRLLAFARRQPLQPVPVDLAQLVSGMAELMASTLGPNIDVKVDLAPALPPAKADPNQLEMALLNLAVNARDAMPGGGTLTVTAERASVREPHPSGLKPGHYVRLGVRDTGDGMDAETLRRAVEPFFSTKGVGKGTGLGLSMVHGLAAQLGGGLAIDSAPGKGTTVELWLPLSAEPLGGEDGGAPALSAQVGRGTALLVDDEELVRMSTADMLGDLGFQVVEASSAEEALELLRGGTAPDLLVTDHLMPGMTGTDLAREARALNPALPVLVVSGYAEVDGIAPDLPRLTKPFRSHELAASVAALLPGGEVPATPPPVPPGP